jgi:alkylation response protein AidB-like acyl-CoA dehydrogenase
MFITNGVHCDWIVLGAKTDKEAGYAGISCFIVDKNAPGFTVGRKLDKVGLWSSDTAELYFSDCRVPASALLGEENKGFFQIMSGFVWERLICSIGSVVAADLSLQMAIDYAKERKQFGRPIMKFQVIGHMLADLKIEIEAARQVTYWCLRNHMKGNDKVSEAAMAKVLSTEVACKAADRALQIHGGYGYMMEYPVQRAWRDTRIGTIYAGTNEIMREIISRDLGV